jgi:glycine/serine hydroxymethyltransferase
VVENARTLAATLKARGANLVAGGTDTHLALVDLPRWASPAAMPTRRWSARASPATRTASPTTR